MANSLLKLLIQRCESHPDYRRYTELFNRLDPSAPPQIELVHRAVPLTLKHCKKLGIFSGSFNPLTLAHTQMAEDTIAKYQLDELLLLLAKANVDKAVFGLPLAARLLTVKRYAESRQKFSVGVSSHGRYIDKVTALKSIFRRAPNSTLLSDMIPSSGYLIQSTTPISTPNCRSCLWRLASSLRTVRRQIFRQ